MYKTQEKTINEICKALDTLEKKTEEKYSVHVGYCTAWKYFPRADRGGEVEGELFATINEDSRLYMPVDGSKCLSLEICHKIERDNIEKIDINENIFLELNNLVDRVYGDKKKINQFHEELNKKLEILNETLENVE